MRRGAGVGGGKAAEAGDIAGQFDDALVVDVVQHKIEVSGLGWPAGPIALGGTRPRPYIWSRPAEIQSSRWPGDTPVCKGRSNGVDMDALIKPLRGNQKPSDVKAPEFHPA